MKINFQKIIAVILACALSVTVFCIPVTADDGFDFSAVLDGITDLPADSSNFAKQFLSLVIEYYKNGKDGSALADSIRNVIDSYGEVDSDLRNIMDEIQSLIDGNNIVEAVDKFIDWLNELGGDIFSTKTEETVPMLGYSAMFLSKRKADGSNYEMLATDGYIVYDPDSNYAEFYGDEIITYFFSSDRTSYRSNGWGTSMDAYMASYVDWGWYGDIRLYDGDDDDSNNDSMETDPTTQDNVTDDVDNLTDEEIIELLEELLKNLMLQFPDLSSLEGLLEAIYYKLGTLDSDNDNALLSQILVAINALQNNDNSSNAELLTCLNDIKNSLVTGTGEGETKQSAAELLKLIADNQIKLKDFKIDESAYLNNYEVLKVKLQNKFSFITELKTLIDTAITAYSSSTNEPKVTFTAFGEQFTIDFSFLNSQLPMIQFMIAAFVYLSYAVRTYRRIPVYINGGGDE